MSKYLEKLQVDLNLLKEANQRLNEALAQPLDEFLRDSVIKRFEFTIELAWKTMKKYLEAQNIQTNSPRNVIEESFREGLIDEPENWGKLLTARNETSHTYSEVRANLVYDQVKTNKYLIDDLIEKLNSFVTYDQ